MSRISRRCCLHVAAGWAAAAGVVARAEQPSSAGAAAAPPAPTEKDPYADAVFVDDEPPLPPAGAFTIAVLPDTQHYSENYPRSYLAQTEWIVAERKRRNIACVLHLGDITNRNTRPEWINALRAMSVLDGQVPYFMAVGNHDYSKQGSCQDRTTLFNEYFPLARYRETPTFGGVYDKEPDRLENSYHLFSAAGREYLVLALEFGPRRDVVRWANEIAARHKNRAAILITHAYIYYDDTRYDWKRFQGQQSWNPHAYPVAKNTDDDVCDGEELWRELVARHENFVLTLNGHVLGDGLGRVITSTPAGREIPQVLVNFQMRPNGGDGWLRLLEISGDGRSARVFDYSPVRKQGNASRQNQFTLTLAPPDSKA